MISNNKVFNKLKDYLESPISGVVQRSSENSRDASYSFFLGDIIISNKVLISSVDLTSEISNEELLLLQCIIQIRFKTQEENRKQTVIKELLKETK